MTTPSRRRTAALVAGLLAVAALAAGCTSSTARTTGTSDGAGVIGVALPQSDDAQWARAGEALRDELTGRGYRVDVQFAAGDARTQGSQVQNMLTKGADAVVVAPLSVDDLDVALQTAVADGIPIVTFERALALPGAGFAAAVDPEALGRAQAQALLSDLPDAATDDDAPSTPPRVAVLTGDAEDAWAVRRYDAAREVLDAAVADGRIEIVAGATLDDAATTGDDDATAAERRTRALLAPEETDVAGSAEDTAAAPTAILALTDATTRGVVTALTTPLPDDATPSPSASGSPSSTPTASPSPGPDLDAELAGQVTVVGSGGDLAIVQALRDGIVDATVFVDPRELVPWAADAVQALLDGDAPRVDGSEPAGLDGVPSATAGASVVRARDIESLLLDTGWLTADDLS
ncbi:substrate-binding domain-containing protein [Microbacterium sp. HMH0099]|uniref:substrate-binding domain-containing protein n=1 Tax=Microbacterium sp. HMH0099 TaxID=3414026 RepID=UPI003BF6A14D